MDGRWDGERPAKAGVPRARRLRREMTVAERWLWDALRRRNERDVRARLPEIVEQIVALTTTPNPDPSPLKGEGSV